MENDIIYFASPAEFRSWLEEHHQTRKELWVGYYKVGTGKPSMTWSDSVDEALCFGWIDGIRKTVDADSYTNRFTPRRPNSNWSAVNIAKVAELTKQGRMMPAGLAIFEKRSEARSSVYTYENKEVELSPVLSDQFKEQISAWNTFQTFSPSSRKIYIRWIMSAKQEATQLKRLAELIQDCENGRNRWGKTPK